MQPGVRAASPSRDRVAQDETEPSAGAYWLEHPCTGFAIRAIKTSYGFNESKETTNVKQDLMPTSLVFCLWT